MNRLLTLLMLLALPALAQMPPPVQTNCTVNIKDTNYSTYYIYYGPSTGNYTNRVTAVRGTNALAGTSKANTYYIAAAGLVLQFNVETPLSNEIIRKPPTPLAFVPPIFTVSFSVTNPSGVGFYRIQFSPDLVNWISSGSNVPTLNIKRVQ
jgi:hypothetical protein